MTKYFCLINNYKFDDKTISMKAVLSIILAEGCYQNSQHVYRGFTIALDQSESRTQLCHVRMIHIYDSEIQINNCFLIDIFDLI